MPADRMLRDRPVKLVVMCHGAHEMLLIKGLLMAGTEVHFECQRVEDLAALDTIMSEHVAQADAMLVWIARPSADEEIALRHIVSAAPHVPLLLSTEFPSAESAVRWAAFGIQDLIPRDGLHPETLANAVIFAIARSQRSARAGHDELTGLPSRSVWQDRLLHALRRSRRNNSLMAMLLIDIDDFKQVNDALGHDIGDAYLIEIGHRICSTVRARDTVARVSGDEFAILLEDVPFAEAALRVARKIIRAAAEPVVLARASLKAAVSIGIAILDPDQPNLDADWAHQASDIALHDAKRLGKNRYSLFTADMDRAMLSSLQLDSDLLDGVENGEFVFHYQPIVGAATGHLEGFEALLRWERASGEILAPSEFLPALERLGLMDRISRTLFARALDQLGNWRTLTRAPLSMHVNLSATQLIDQHFSDMLLALIAHADVPPSALTIELTETAAFRYGALIEGEFARLRRHGVRFAIDDFGTGYNSMTYLKQFQPDVVKIDRSFITTMNESRVDAAIVRAQSVMAEALGIDAVAEGVETLEQLDALRMMRGVNFIQGYLTGRPMSAADLERDYIPLRDMLHDRHPQRMI
jgi:diguanylate cyclase (GGDEF)-like protein